MKNLCFLLLLILGSSLYAQKIERIEPPFWYVGMENNQLELLIYGKDISQFTPSVDNKNILILDIKKTGNNNYLFLNLDLSNAVSGKFNINFSKKDQGGNIIINKVFTREDILGFVSKGVLLLTTK